MLTWRRAAGYGDVDTIRPERPRRKTRSIVDAFDPDEADE